MEEKIIHASNPDGQYTGIALRTFKDCLLYQICHLIYHIYYEITYLQLDFT